MSYSSQGFVGFLQAMVKKREQDLEASLADERARRKDMAAIGAGMREMFGYVGDYARQAKQDTIANQLMNEGEMMSAIGPTGMRQSNPMGCSVFA
jgi:hypothetical protein